MIYLSAITSVGFTTLASHPQNEICLVGGAADVSIVRAPTRPCHHRFTVGEAVYALSFSTDGYARNRVKGVYSHGTSVLYDLGAERLVAEQYVIGTDEYRAQFGKRKAAIRREAERHKSHVQVASTTLLPMGRERS